MEHTITEFKEWPEGLEVCYHDWVIKASAKEIEKKLGFKPLCNKSLKCRYTWHCNLDDGKYFFTIYDMSYDDKLKKNEIAEFHIGFDCNYDDVRNFWPNKVEALEMLEALVEIGLKPDHSETWKFFHKSGLVDIIDKKVKENLYGSSSEFYN